MSFNICSKRKKKKEHVNKVLPRFELGSWDSESQVLTVTPQDLSICCNSRRTIMYRPHGGGTLTVLPFWSLLILEARTWERGVDTRSGLKQEVSQATSLRRERQEPEPIGLSACLKMLTCTNQIWRYSLGYFLQTWWVSTFYDPTVPNM